MEWQVPKFVFRETELRVGCSGQLGKGPGGRANEVSLDNRVLYDTDPAVTVG